MITVVINCTNFVQSPLHEIGIENRDDQPTKQNPCRLMRRCWLSSRQLESG